MRFVKKQQVVNSYVFNNYLDDLGLFQKVNMCNMMVILRVVRET